MTTRIDCPQTIAKLTAGVLNCQVSCDSFLRTGETISTVGTAAVSPSGLTIANEATNGDALTILGASVAAGRAITFTASSGTAGYTYTVTISFVTSASQTHHVRCRISVVS